jgi:hypothetical protein
LPTAPFIAVTDKAWFDFLETHVEHGVVDEVNFWSPSSTEPLKDLHPGEPVFFRLKKPWHAGSRRSMPRYPRVSVHPSHAVAAVQSGRYAANAVGSESVLSTGRVMDARP